MIKYEINNGDVETLKFEGNIDELAADTMTLIIAVYKAILSEKYEKSADAAGHYRAYVMGAMQSILPKVFIDYLVESSKKEEKSVTTQEKREAEVTNFAKEFLKFLYEEDDNK